MGDLFVVGQSAPVRFFKVLGAGPSTLFLRPYSKPPDIRWRPEPGFPDLIIEPQPTDREIHVLEVSRDDFQTWNPAFRAKAGMNSDEKDVLDKAMLEKIPFITAVLLAQLTNVEPSRDGALEYRPCRIRLKDGRVLDRVYVVDAERFIQLWGLWPQLEWPQRALAIDDVETMEDCPARIPAGLATRMYEAGESAMGRCFFTLVLKDGRRLACATGDAVDFVALPPDIESDMIIDLLPHEGRSAREHFRGADFFWCLFRSPNPES